MRIIMLYLQQMDVPEISLLFGHQEQWFPRNFEIDLPP